MSQFFCEISDPNSSHTWPRRIYSALRAPAYHIYFELILICGIVWLIFKRSYKIHEQTKLTESEKLQLIDEWEPEPLIPADWSPNEKLLEGFNRTATGALGKYVRFANEKDTNGIGSLPYLNAASLNFLNFVGDSELNTVAIKNLEKYGVGSCGPRGFYGTFDVHLSLESALEKFLGVEEVSLYSFGFSTVASAIPAYAKRTDIIFADKGVSQSVYEGLIASRSTLKFFSHNDMDDLEELLTQQSIEDAKDPKKALTMRRFFVVEGVYLDYGDICQLPRLIELKYRYKVRIMLDESISFGVLGNNGRGLTEYYGIDIKHVDIITGSLEYAVGILGGFCAGTHHVIDHQRLSGQGYCFSASMPPLLAAGCEAVLAKLASEQGLRQARLLQLSRRLHSLLTVEAYLSPYWRTEGHPDSPIKHLRLCTGNTIDRLERAVDLAASLPLQHKVSIVSGEDLKSESPRLTDMERTPVLLTLARHIRAQSRYLPPPSIRLAVNFDLSDEELLHICDILLEVGRCLHPEQMITSWRLKSATSVLSSKERL